MIRDTQVGHWMRGLLCGVLFLGVFAAPQAAWPVEVNGRIVEQDLTGDQGYTVLHVWGSPYEMGYAHGYLLGEYIDLAYEQMTTVFGYYWPAARELAAGWTYRPLSIEEEFQGMLDGVRERVPSTVIDLLDLKTANTFGDWFYSFACRSTCCWDTVVAAPFQTLAIRKLQFSVLPPQFTQQWHHVICAWQPTDDSLPWVNFSFPGYVCVVTGVNEVGTLASLHDWNSSYGPDHPAALPRTVACRYALTMELGPDPLTHLQTAFDELQTYDVATGGFLNYYVPDGGAGVIKTSKSLGFYDVRLPQEAWMDGCVISTNNNDIDGTYGIQPWVGYYQSLDPPGGVQATMDGLWSVGYQATDWHIAEIGFRGLGDMTLWFTGRLQSTTLPRLAFEWSDLFHDPAHVVDGSSVRLLPAHPNPVRGNDPGTTVLLPSIVPAGEDPGHLAIHDAAGRRVCTLAPDRIEPLAGDAHATRVVYRWNGTDHLGRRVSPGVYLYRVCTGSAAGRIVWIGQ